jgi:hypothetical protein
VEESRKPIRMWTSNLECYDAARETHNYKSSPFHNLPVELLLDISEQSSPSSRLMLQRVCHRFRACLAPSGVSPEIKDQLLTVQDFLQFCLLLRRDRQLTLEDVYDSTISNCKLNNLGCTGCRTTHGIEYFSTNQLDSSSKARICKGLEGSIKLCEHYSFHGFCLLRGLRELQDAELRCNRDHICRVEDQGEDVRMRFSAAVLRFRLGHTITIDRQSLILSSTTVGDITHEAIFSAICRLDLTICPHLNSSSAELFDGKPIPAERLSDILLWQSTPRIWAEFFPGLPLRQGKSVVWWKCFADDCLTRYGLICIAGDGLARVNCHRSAPPYRVVLEVSSDLVDGPTHSSWQAQLSPEVNSGKCRGECCLRWYQAFLKL